MHREAIVPFIIVMCCFVGMVTLVAGSIIKWHLNIKKYKPEKITPSRPKTVTAEVVSKRMDIRYFGGYKFPRHEAVYLITFKTKNNRTKEYAVSRKLYERCKEHSKGTLVTINGDFLDFGEGENM